MVSLRCFFVSDLHGRVERYRKLFELVRAETPDAIFMGGDLLPMAFDHQWADNLGVDDFVEDFLLVELSRLAQELGSSYPRVFVILGNDDPKAQESSFLEGDRLGLLSYAHGCKSDFEGYPVYGYAFVPPTPFRLKDWERYDVSRYVDPGCVSPEQGVRSVPVPERDIRYATIAEDLRNLIGQDTVTRAVFLFHSPPHDTNLDRAALDGKMVDHVPMKLHVGSIAIRRFIESRQPLITLHGHVHESARITGSWRDRIGKTHMFSAAHDGPELALIRFDPEAPEKATRELC